MTTHRMVHDRLDGDFSLWVDVPDNPNRERPVVGWRGQVVPYAHRTFHKGFDPERHDILDIDDEDVDGIVMVANMTAHPDTWIRRAKALFEKLGGTCNKYEIR